MQKKSMVKLSLLTLIVAFMAFGTIAIAKTVITNETPANKTVTTEPWYFQGDDPEVAENYSRTGAPEKPCGTVEQTICEIFAPEDGMNPGYPKLDTLIGSATVLQHLVYAVTAFRAL